MPELAVLRVASPAEHLQESAAFLLLVVELGAFTIVLEVGHQVISAHTFTKHFQNVFGIFGCPAYHRLDWYVVHCFRTVAHQVEFLDPIPEDVSLEVFKSQLRILLLAVRKEVQDAALD